MNRDLVRQAACIVALALTLGVNYLSNALPLNGRTAGEISDSFAVLFVPAGYVFAIWGLIYLLLIAFVIYQARPAAREDPRLRAVGWPFVASCLLNAAWLVAWHYGYYPLSVGIMLALLGCLIVIYRRLGVGRGSPPGRERWLVDLPFSVYLGWITVATVANVSIMLFDAGWNGQPLGPVPWTIAMLVVGAGLGLAMLRLRADLAYALVLIWAYVGIWVKQAPTPTVATTSLILALVLVVAAAWTWWRGRGGRAGLGTTGREEISSPQPS
jgi:benzodiazapine receptor